MMALITEGKDERCAEFGKDKSRAFSQGKGAAIRKRTQSGRNKWSRNPESQRASGSLVYILPRRRKPLPLSRAKMVSGIKKGFHRVAHDRLLFDLGGPPVLSISAIVACIEMDKCGILYF